MSVQTVALSAGVPLLAAVPPSLQRVTLIDVWRSSLLHRGARGQMGARLCAHRVLQIAFLLLLLKHRTALTTVTAGQGKISLGLTRLRGIRRVLRTSHHWPNGEAEELLLPRRALWPPASDLV